MFKSIFSDLSSVLPSSQASALNTRSQEKCEKNMGQARQHARPMQLGRPCSSHDHFFFGGVSGQVVLYHLVGGLVCGQVVLDHSAGGRGWGGGEKHDLAIKVRS